MNILIYIMATASFIGSIFIAWSYFQGYSCRNWPSTKGIIVQSKLMEFRNYKKVKKLLIYYKYGINNKDYYSRRLMMYVTDVFENKKAEVMLKTYPVEKEVIVRHHPLFHGFAVLNTGPVQPFIHLFIFIIFMLFFAVSLVAILMPGYNLFFEAIMLFNG